MSLVRRRRIKRRDRLAQGAQPGAQALLVEDPLAALVLADLALRDAQARRQRGLIEPGVLAQLHEDAAHRRG
jgi:hypothetical protein